MLFSESIPDMVFETPIPSKFIRVLDSLQEHKQGIISDAIRSFNPILCTDEKWLRKYLTDYGFNDIPKGFPSNVLQQMLLNADTIMRLRGSRLGLEFFLSVCSLGSVTIGTANINSVVDVIFLDSLFYGYISDSRSLYLCDNNKQMGTTSTLNVTINSKYFDGSHQTEAIAIEKYLRSVVPRYVGFSHNFTFTLTKGSRSSFYYHELLNPNFVEA